VSEGPIKREREATRVQKLSTNPTTSLHFAGAPGRAHCGSKKASKFTDGWRFVDCSACLAAGRADGLIE
jgi:hypothetical protein